jgi:carbamoyltransferase
MARDSLTCGVKLTHDGGFALIEGNRLVHSIEMEKIDNNRRHMKVNDLSEIFVLLEEYGYDPDDIDSFVLDGWRRPHLPLTWGDQHIALSLAPYRQGILRDELFAAHHFRVIDLEYVSYSHYAGHVAAAYCTSPFARQAQPSYVLCWDGAMFPFLYFVEPTSSRVRSLGPLFFMIGDTYHTLSQSYAPFDTPTSWPLTLSLPGKIMAYVGYGVADPGALEFLHGMYRDAVRVVLGGQVANRSAWTERAGRQILRYMDGRARLSPLRPQDAIATIHVFLGNLLIEHARRAIEADGEATTNLCLTGGCALNIKWNRQIRESGVCSAVWVPPFPNDAGSAIGAACCQLFASGQSAFIDWDVYLGPRLDSFARRDGWRPARCSVDELAVRLDVIGDPVLVLNGRAELGPRALGNRSLIAPAVHAEMRDLVNRVKSREEYRPVAPVCLEEEVAEVFSPGVPDPYMLFDQTVRESWRSRVPAICHVDGTARVQTVTSRSNSVLHELLSVYRRRTGIPLLCNTSANFPGRGFFPDPGAAMDWGQVTTIWSEGTLYERAGARS